MSTQQPSVLPTPKQHPVKSLSNPRPTPLPQPSAPQKVATPYVPFDHVDNEEDGGFVVAVDPPDNADVMQIDNEEEEETKDDEEKTNGGGNQENDDCVMVINDAEEVDEELPDAQAADSQTDQNLDEATKKIDETLKAQTSTAAARAVMKTTREPVAAAPEKKRTAKVLRKTPKVVVQEESATTPPPKAASEATQPHKKRPALRLPQEAVKKRKAAASPSEQPTGTSVAPAIEKKKKSRKPATAKKRDPAVTAKARSLVSQFLNDDETHEPIEQTPSPADPDYTQFVAKMKARAYMFNVMANCLHACDPKTLAMWNTAFRNNLRHCNELTSTETENEQ